MDTGFRRHDGKSAQKSLSLGRNVIEDLYGKPPSKGEPVETWLLVLGFAAQGLFAARFLVQWIASERVGRSIVPISFWFLSVCGGTLLLVYAVLRKDPVFILGQSSGLIIYSRNLYLIYKERKRRQDHFPEGSPETHPESSAVFQAGGETQKDQS